MSPLLRRRFSSVTHPRPAVRDRARSRWRVHHEIVVTIVLTLGVSLILLVLWWPGQYLALFVAGVATVVVALQLLVAIYRTRRRIVHPQPTPPWNDGRRARRPHWRGLQVPRARQRDPVPVEPAVLPAAAPRGGPMPPHASPRHASMTRTDAPTLPVVVAGVAGTITAALGTHAIAASLTAITTTPHRIDVELTATETLAPPQLRQLKAAAAVFGGTPRWVGTTLQIPLPQRMPATTAQACVPVLRRRGSVVWWPLSTSGSAHVLISGDGGLTLGAALGSLLCTTAHVPLDFLVHDPERVLAGLHMPRLEPSIDALATARMRALQIAWARDHGEHLVSTHPTVLVVVNPDEVVWRDLMPLLRNNNEDVHVIALVHSSAHIPEMREACHRVPVIEVLGPGTDPLPDSCHPSGVPIPRAHEVVAWHSARLSWRGTSVCEDERALQRDWLSGA